MKKMLAVFCILLASLVQVFAQVVGANIPFPNINVVSQNVRFTANGSLFPVALLSNDGPADLFFAIGGATITANTSSTRLRSGERMYVAITNSAAIAAVTAGVATSMSIVQMTGPAAVIPNGPGQNTDPSCAVPGYVGCSTNSRIGQLIDTLGSLAKEGSPGAPQKDTQTTQTVCNKTAFLEPPAAGVYQLILGVASARTLVCGVKYKVGADGTIQFGTAANNSCSVSTISISPNWPVKASDPEQGFWGPWAGFGTTNPADDLCVTVTGPSHVLISYGQW
jgi:hypothetical protein